MTTELMLIGMKYQQKFNTWLGSFPIEFDYSTQLYTFKRSFKKLKLYYFDVAVLLFGVNFGSNLFVLIIRSYHPDPMFKMHHFFLFGFLVIVMGMLVGIALSIYIHGDYLVQTLNSMMLQFRQLQRILIGDQGKKVDGKKQRKSEHNFQALKQKIKQLCYEENGTLDIMGISTLYFATYSLWFHYMVAFGALIFDINPMRHFAHAAFGNDFMNQLKVRILAGFFYWIVLLLNTATGNRLCQLIVILFVIPLQFQIKLTDLMEKLYSRCSSVKEYERHHLEYVKLQLVVMIISPLIENEAYLLMLISRAICVIGLFIVIKLHAYVGAVAIAGAGCGALVTVGLSNLLFPYTYKLMHNSSCALHDWLSNLPHNQKYLRRKYASLRYLRFYAGLQGTHFMLDRSTTLDVMKGILEPTIDLLIAYPDEDIKRMFGTVRA